MTTASTRVLAALRELRDAPALDLRLKHALIFGEARGTASEASSRSMPSNLPDPASACEPDHLFDLGGES